MIYLYKKPIQLLSRIIYTTSGSECHCEFNHFSMRVLSLFFHNWLFLRHTTPSQALSHSSYGRVWTCRSRRWRREKPLQPPPPRDPHSYCWKTRCCCGSGPREEAPLGPPREEGVEQKALQHLEAWEAGPCLPSGLWWPCLASGERWPHPRPHRASPHSRWEERTDT